MLNNIVYVTALIITVSSAPQYQQEQHQRFRSPEAGKLLRVVENQRVQNNPSISKVFYYVPTNVDSAENAAKNQKISILPTDPNFVENTMKIIEETGKTEKVEKEKLVNNDQVGVYYIYHPNGVLQRVEYLTENEDDMTVSTRVRYKVVEPIKGPIYTYDPQTLLYRQI